LNNDRPHLGPTEIRLRDPLTEVTRKERRTLLVVSTVGIIMVKSGLVPSRITALGIEFAKTDQRALIVALGAVVTYFVAAFVIYAVSDMVAWRVAFHTAVNDWVREQDRLEKEEAMDVEGGGPPHESLLSRLRWSRFSGPISALRAVFEFLIPVIIGAYAAWLLFTAAPPG
jgi:hypothetical protein